MSDLVARLDARGRGRTQKDRRIAELRRELNRERAKHAPSSPGPNWKDTVAKRITARSLALLVYLAIAGYSLVIQVPATLEENLKGRAEAVWLVPLPYVTILLFAYILVRVIRELR